MRRRHKTIETMENGCDRLKIPKTNTPVSSVGAPQRACNKANMQAREECTWNIAAMIFLWSSLPLKPLSTTKGEWLEKDTKQAQK